jgi:hypothetical protein
MSNSNVDGAMTHNAHAIDKYTALCVAASRVIDAPKDEILTPGTNIDGIACVKGPHRVAN